MNIALTCDPDNPTSDCSILSTVLNGWDSITEQYEHPILRFFTTKEARELRFICREFLHSVECTPWNDLETPISCYPGYYYSDIRTMHYSPLEIGIPFWRKSFPNAIGARLSGREDLTDEILVHLRGIQYLIAPYEYKQRSMRGGYYTRRFSYKSVKPIDDSTITDLGLLQLRGIRHLNLRNRQLSNITDAGFTHLRGIEHLDIRECSLPTISPTTLLQLQDIATFSV
jgi:hypothetical protein